jgi:cystathionine gamma-synthase
MSITVVSKSPPGGRCTLYARYAEALAGHYGLTVDIHCPGETAMDGPDPPALVIRGRTVAPSDGVIVAPEDIARTLAQAGLDDGRLAECLSELERIQDDFIEGASHG